MIDDSRNGEQELMILRRYLLGQLDKDSCKKLEARLLPDGELAVDHDSLAELMQVAEDSIIDDYQFGNLSYEDRRAMALRFSWTTMRREKLRLAAQLAEMAETARGASDGVPEGVVMPPAPHSDRGDEGTEPWRRAGVSPWARAPEAGGWSIPTWAPVAAALFMVVAIAVAFQAGSRLQADATAFLALDPAVRGAGGTLAIDPRGEKILRLQLEIGDRYEAYRAELYRGAEAEYVLRSGPLTVQPYEDTSAVALPVPTELLPPGDYHVLLYGLSEGETATFVARLDFSIRD